MNDVATLAAPLLIDGVIAVTLIEAVVLLLIHRRTGQGVAPRDFLANLVSGLCLMLALRSLVHDAGSGWLAACLLAAGIAHGTDIVWRWRRRSRASSIHRRVTA